MTHHMKSFVISLFAAALSATSAMAETRVAIVNVPFAFMAGSSEMPARHLLDQQVRTTRPVPP